MVILCKSLHHITIHLANAFMQSDSPFESVNQQSVYFVFVLIIYNVNDEYKKQNTLSCVCNLLLTLIDFRHKENSIC